MTWWEIVVVDVVFLACYAYVRYRLLACWYVSWRAAVETLVKEVDSRLTPVDPTPAFVVQPPEGKPN